MDASKKYSYNYSELIVGYVTFVGDSSRGLLFPALWPLCQRLGGGKIEQGILVALFSLGRALVSTQFGVISDKYRHRFTLQLANIIFVLAVILWALCPLFGSIRVLYLAQFLMGIGTSTLGVTRAYIAERTPPCHRTNALARLSALQYAGFAITPMFGAMLVVQGAKLSPIFEFVMPALFLLLLIFIGMLLLQFYFQDISTAEEDENAYALVDVSEFSQKSEEIKDTNIKHAPVSSYKSNLGPRKRSLSSISGDHSHSTDSLLMLSPRSNSPRVIILAPIIDVEQPEMKKQDSMNCDSMVPPPNEEKNEDTTALIEVTSLLSTEKSNNQAQENAFLQLPDQANVYYLLMALNFTTRGCIAIYETQSPRIFLDLFHLSFMELGAFVSVSGLIGTMLLVFYKSLLTDRFTDVALILGGLCLMAAAQLLILNWTGYCSQQENHMPEMWTFSTTMLMVYGIGFPIANTAAVGSFSTLMKSGRQGLSQGKFAFTASVARILFPMLSKLLEQYYGLGTSFSLCLLLMASSVLSVLWWYTPLVKYTDRNPTTGGTPTGRIAILGLDYVRNSLGLASVGLLVVGSVVLFTSFRGFSHEQ